jgi:chromosome segregation ATPase
MSQNEIIALAATTFIALVGYLIRGSVQGVNTRLDKLEGTLDTLVKQMVAAATKQDVNAAEIEKLRAKVHELESEVAALNAVQSRCRSCNPRP